MKSLKSAGHTGKTICSIIQRQTKSVLELLEVIFFALCELYLN